MTEILDLLRHLPEHLGVWAQEYGTGVYVIVGLIVFAETGLVIAPFLPGDSLLFAIGVLLSRTPDLDVFTMLAVLIGAAIVGDAVNFHVGRWMAPRLFGRESSRWLNKKHLEKTRAFYERHGGKTVVLARFLPILRTYAPFVSGLSGMPFSRFFMFSVSGGIAWVCLFVLAGYYFGNLPGIQANFHYAIIGILVVSCAPIAIEVIRSRFGAREASSSTPT